MIHGGIRYLQQLEIRLVYQSLSERQRLLRNAPHLVRTLPFVMAIYTTGGMIPRFLARFLGLVLWFYDVTGGAKIGHRHRRLNRDETIAHMPVLDAARIHSSYLYYDAQVDDARMTMAIARTAALDHGAVIANHAPVVALHKNDSGQIVGATIDPGDRPQIDVRARAVVNAAGVWIDAVDELDGDAAQDVRPARGVHIVVPRALLGNDAAMILSVPGKRTSVFAVPWGDHTYIGTTDTDYDGDPDRPYCTAADTGLLLDSLNGSTTRDLTVGDVVGTWAGLRPLLRTAKDNKTADLSRRHRVTRSESGLVTVSGGKLTTWRQMAQDTVDEALDILGRQGRLPHQEAPPARRRGLGSRRARRRHPSDTRPPRGTLRRRGRSGHRVHRRGPEPRRAARIGAAVSAGRSRVRRPPRDGRDTRRRACPPHPSSPARPRRLPLTRPG